jgi:hypothetical protein
LLSVGAGLRLLASFLVLMWTLPAATAVQAGQDFAKGQMTLAAPKPVAHPTILVRDIVRHVAAETSRFKTGPYAPVVEGDGKSFAILPNSLLSLEAASGAPVGLCPEAWPKLPPTRAFDARAPPLLTA